MLSKGLCNNTPWCPTSLTGLVNYSHCLQGPLDRAQSKASVGMFNLHSWASFLLLPFAAKSCDVVLTDTERRRGGEEGMEAAAPLTRNLISPNAQKASRLTPSIYSQSALLFKDPRGGCSSYSLLSKGRPSEPIGCSGCGQVGFPEPQPFFTPKWRVC